MGAGSSKPTPCRAIIMLSRTKAAKYPKGITSISASQFAAQTFDRTDIMNSNELLRALRVHNVSFCRLAQLLKGHFPKRRKWPLSARPRQRNLHVMRNPLTVPKPLPFSDDKYTKAPNASKNPNSLTPCCLPVAPPLCRETGITHKTW